MVRLTRWGYLSIYDVDMQRDRVFDGGERRLANLDLSPLEADVGRQVDQGRVTSELKFFDSLLDGGLLWRS